MFSSRNEILDHHEQLVNQIDVLAEKTLIKIKRVKTKNEQIANNVNALRQQFLDKIKTIREYNLNNINKKSYFCFVVEDFVEESSRKKGQFCHLVIMNEVLSKQVLNSVRNPSVFQMFDSIADDNKPMIIRDLFRKKFKNPIIDLSEPEKNELDDVYISIGNFKYEDSSFDFLSKLINIYKIERIEIKNYLNIKIPSECFRNFPNLKNLKYSIGKCDRFFLRNFELLTNLKEICITSQSINTVEKDAFYNLANLEILEMPSANIEIIEEGAFNGLVSLKHLDLRENKIRIIKKNTFKNLNKLEFFNLNQNPIRKIEKHSFDDLKNLQVLFMKFNGKEIKIEPDAFNLLTKLEILDLEFSLFKNYNISLFKLTENLKLLNLKYHKIEHIGFLNELKNLEVLDISESESIANINEIKLEKLKILSIPFESVTKFESNFKSLQALYIDECIEFEEGCFENLENLKFLKICVKSLNVILDMKEDIFLSLYSLRYFGLCLNIEDEEESERIELFQDAINEKLFIFEELMNVSLECLDIGLHVNQKKLYLEIIDRNLRLDKIEKIVNVSLIVAENWPNSIYTSHGSINLVRMRRKCTLM